MKQTTTNRETMSKKVSHAFGKDVYLLGMGEDGTMYWLEAQKWDCGWYWGFGYVEAYTNNKNPAKAKDISSHEHIDSSFMGQSEYYDHAKGCFRKGEYISNLFDSPRFSATTFTENEGWTLSELFKTFYNLRQSAEVFGRGGSHITDNPCKDTIKNEAWTKHINEVMIPAVTAKIIEILTP